MEKYRVKPSAIFMHPHLSTQIDGMPISLNGKPGVHKRPETKEGPAQETVMPAATQAQLELLFKQGNPLIEKYEEEKHEKTDAVAKPG